MWERLKQVVQYGREWMSNEWIREMEIAQMGGASLGQVAENYSSRSEIWPTSHYPAMGW